MNREQAKIALSKGERLTHRYFTSDEWVQGHGLMYEFEDGCLCTPEDFWRYREDSGFDEGWEIWLDPKIQELSKKAATQLFKTETYKFDSKHEKPWYNKGRW